MESTESRGPDGVPGCGCADSLPLGLQRNQLLENYTPTKVLVYLFFTFSIALSVFTHFRYISLLLASPPVVRKTLVA